MDDSEIRNILNDYIKEICHYSQKQVFATSSHQKNYFQIQIDEAVNDLVYFIQLKLNRQDQQVYYQQTQPEQQTKPENILQEELKEPSRTAVPEKDLILTADQLAYYDGSGGKPAYVAVNGTIYDVTNVIGWAGGTHFGQYAGKDLNNVFMKCHHGMLETLAKVPQVGILIK